MDAHAFNNYLFLYLPWYGSMVGGAVVLTEADSCVEVTFFLET